MITLKVIIRRSFAKRTSGKDWSYFCKKSCKFREICNACCGDDLDADPFYGHCDAEYINDFTILEVIRNG